jgi:uncharacterized protein (DUF2249 family)
VKGLNKKQEMTINVNTKIASLIKEDHRALEAIVSISPTFTKLRNPVLRKVIAGRTSIAMAAKMGGCTTNDFFNKLEPLGFEIDKATIENKDHLVNKRLPDFLQNIDPRKITDLDVRPLIEKGNDPLNIILKTVKGLQDGEVLKIINSFEPTPLLRLLEKQGFETYVENISSDLVHSYFSRKDNKTIVAENKTSATSADWDEVLTKFSHKLEHIDVRQMEMPLPMHTIMDALGTLPAGKALYVYHKRIPVFLLPELVEMKFSYRIKEIKEGEVHLLIYKD